MSGQTTRTKTAGVYQRHRAGCRGGKCSCPYRATVWSRRDNKLITRQFDSLAEAKTWRQDALPAVRRNELRAPTRITVREAAEELIHGMESGAVFDRSGRPFKPSTVRGYEQSLRDYVIPALGYLRLSVVDRGHVQDLVDSLTARGLSASTVRNTLCPLQTICRRAIHANRISVDPTKGLLLPRATGKRDRIVSPEYAGLLVEALPESDRALWATALYAGLRCGELRALRWRDVDLAEQVIHVKQGWDEYRGAQEPKSEAGRRTVPMADSLRSYLADHGLATMRSGEELVFGRTATGPFTKSTINLRAKGAWTAAGLEPITLHEARHCCASFLIACGVSIKELTVYLGHGDVRTSINRYGHLLPGGHALAAKRLSTFLEPASVDPAG